MERGARAFIDSIEAENQAYEAGFGPTASISPDCLTSDSEFRPLEIPFSQMAGESNIQFLIRKVDAVVMETAQLGTEPLTTKAAILAALYQADALRAIADCLQEMNHGLTELLDHMRSLTGTRKVSKGDQIEDQNYIRTGTLLNP